ncbi:MAG: outer membrane beta-barrel protein [Chlorobiales bacterium]|nr:outer membrane beta-barrel protein [Chlorobiales bacterium]
MMKKSLAVLGVVLTAGLLNVPAYAGPSVYVSGNIGEASFNDINQKVPGTQEIEGTISTKSGINVLGAVGLKCCDTNLRLEAEYGYQRNSADTYKMKNHVFDLPGNYTVSSYMANGYYDIKAGVVNPYFTAGIGLAEVGVHNVPNPPSIINETHSVLGYQFGAGFAIPVTQAIDIDARYRYFGTSTVTLSDNNGHFILPGSSFLVGLRVGL